MPKKEIEEVVEKQEVGIDVADPEILRPVELPLVVKPSAGKSWDNEAQAEFARVINAYAYKNPEKWETKKDKLIAQLKELGKNPGKAAKITGTNEKGKLMFKNKLHETE